jgi:hypothetical protein
MHLSPPSFLFPPQLVCIISIMNTDFKTQRELLFDNAEDYCHDLIVRVDDATILLHRSVLMVSSVYFRSLLGGEGDLNFRTNTEEATRLALKYIYTNDTYGKLTVDNVLDVWDLSRTYMLETLTNECLQFLQMTSNILSLVPLYLACRGHAITGDPKGILAPMLQRRIAKNFDKISGDQGALRQLQAAGVLVELVLENREYRNTVPSSPPLEVLLMHKAPAAASSSRRVSGHEEVSSGARGKGSVSCDICKKTFSSALGLNAHISNMAKSGQATVCGNQSHVLSAEVQCKLDTIVAMVNDKQRKLTNGDFDDSQEGQTLRLRYSRILSTACAPNTVSGQCLEALKRTGYY